MTTYVAVKDKIWNKFYIPLFVKNRLQNNEPFQPQNTQYYELQKISNHKKILPRAMFSSK
jgi:hypothetical protein